MIYCISRFPALSCTYFIGMKSFQNQKKRKEKKMVEGALFHLAGKVLELLGSFTLLEVKLAFGVKTEIENLKNIVSTIQVVILYAEK